MSLSLCFPTPLPDETIYSLFCRYHVRSCNASDNTTIHQLFNKKRSMQTTVFSAFPLKHARHLEESFHGISIESLLQKNTAMPFYRVFKPRTNTSCHSYASDRFLMAMYNNCCTFTKNSGIARNVLRLSGKLSVFLTGRSFHRSTVMKYVTYTRNRSEKPQFPTRMCVTVFFLLQVLFWIMTILQKTPIGSVQ